jgi:hypothetical protein
LRTLKKIHHASQSLKITKDSKSSVVGLKETLRHLSDDGKPLGMFGKFLVTKMANLWSIAMGRRSYKMIRKHKFLYLFTFTLEIVGYFIFFQNQWDITKENYHQNFSQTSRHKVRIEKPISVAEQNEYKTTEFYSDS